MPVFDISFDTLKEFMEHDFYEKSLIGKIWTWLMGIGWVVILIAFPYELIREGRANIYGLVLMFVGFLLLVFSKRRFLKVRRYWLRFGFSHLESTDRNIYFLSYMLMYLGFVLSLVN